MANVGFPQGRAEERLHRGWKHEVHMDWTILGFREWVAANPGWGEIQPPEYKEGECPF